MSTFWVVMSVIMATSSAFLMYVASRNSKWTIAKSSIIASVSFIVMYAFWLPILCAVTFQAGRDWYQRAYD